MSNTNSYEPSKTTLFLDWLQTTLFFNLGGPVLMPMCYQVNFFKGFTFVWVICLMLYFKNTSPAMILYLILHGSYGICWVIKDFMFPDARAQKMGTVCSHALLFILLTFYWMIPLPLAMGLGPQRLTILQIGLYSVIYLAGLTLMMGSDYQKYKTLQLRKGLIDTYFFKYSRNPNYLGEILIYLSFCLCSGHCLSFLFFILPASILFSLNIYLKEQMSFKTKKGYDKYSKQSNILLFKISQNQIVDSTAYVLGIGLAFYLFWRNKSPDFFYPFDSTGNDL